VAQARRADAGMQLDRYGQMKPVGPRRWLNQPLEEVSAICPFSPSARNEDEIAAYHFPAAPNRNHQIGLFEASYVGSVSEGDYRTNGSSGGMVSWVAAELLRHGLVDGVAHVAADDPAGGRLFRYRISRTLEDIQAGAKSRYYPVELSEVLNEIRDVPGRYALIGIPCFIKAARLSCMRDSVLNERIVFTLGLFCGHMKSARMAESFAWQMDVAIADVEQFEYRTKNVGRPANWYTAQVRLADGTIRSRDWWHLADGDWGAGFFQNSACNFCDDVAAETADISFGDAWVEPYSSDGRGTNVVVVRSPELNRILRAGIEARRLELEDVTAEFVAGTQAAGFRQRREGLAFRLTWPRLGIRPEKRVSAHWRGLAVERMIIYAMRYQVSAWSHRIFWLARLLRRPQLYISWARIAMGVYHGLAYSRGTTGRIADRLGIGAAESRD
jgi:coenzyme F420-reducing hydrogenase beta subunit